MQIGLTTYSLPNLNITSISFYDSTLICGTTTTGVFCYLNNQWVNNNKGMVCSYVYAMTNIDSFIVASAWDSVFISDKHNNWKSVTPIYPRSFFAGIRSNNDTLVLSVDRIPQPTAPWPYFFHYMLYSTDKGLTWDSLINQPPFVRGDPYGIYLFHKRLYAYVEDQMYFTDNLGLTWTNISLPSAYCNAFYGFAVFDSIPFASACGNAQLIKLDSSLNWVLSNSGLPGSDGTNAIAFCNSTLYTFTSGGGMFASSNRGNTWSYASSGLSTGFVDFVSYNSSLFVATGNGVFVTSNNGQNWYSLNHGLKSLNASSIKILNDTVYVGTNGNGIWKQAIADMDLGIQQQHATINSLNIFPNPFSSNTTLQTTNLMHNATLTATNCLGQVVKQIKNLNGQSITFNQDNLTTGVYFIQLTQNDKVIVSGKLIVVDK